MTLYLIGTGLWHTEDISLRGLAAAKKSKKVFLETYTSIGPSIAELSKLMGKEVIPADRNLVENRSDEIVLPAKDGDVTLLVIGDPLSATTHVDIVTRAREEGVEVKIIHNASVLTAIGETGLELYKFGKVTSIPFTTPSFRPETPYDVYLDNASLGLHTLFLLDLKPEEDKFLSANQAAAYLLEISTKRKDGKLNKDTPCVACARLGSDDQEIYYGSFEDLVKRDLGKPPHCLIIPGKLHFVEEDFLKQFL